MIAVGLRRKKVRTGVGVVLPKVEMGAVVGKLRRRS